MKKTIYLTERDIHQMIKESVHTLLLEADTKVIRARNGCAPYLKKFGDIKEAFRKFREDFYGEGLMGNNMLWSLQLAPMFCKFAVENGWTPTSGVITEVKKILFEIVIHHGKDDVDKLVNEFKNNPNEITWSFIRDKYQAFIDKRQEEQNARISQNQYTKDNRYNYDVYGPLTFEEAKKYGDYSYPNDKICYTQREDTWNSPSYTANNTRKVYVLVLSNWKDIPCEHTSDGYFTHTIYGDTIPTDDNGYDLYGMSMIFLIVDKSGDLVVSNTRWNHGCSGRDSNIDHMFIKEDIYKLIGSEKADNIFNSPYQNIEYQSIQDALNKGVSIKELFDDWEDIGNGCFTVCIEGKWTILDNNKQILYKPNNPEQWFDSIYKFDSNGIAVVELNDKWTWFSLEKQDYLFPNKWFQWVDDFDSNGLAKVKLDYQFNWFSLEKQDYLSPNKWFDSVNDFDDNGLAIVKLNRKVNWFSLEKQEEVFPNQWFDRVDIFSKYGIAKVKLNKQINFFSFKKQDYLFPKLWFDEVGPIDNGLAIVELNGNGNFFSFKKQDLLFPNQWFNVVDYFDDGIARVNLNGKWNWFSSEKEDYLSPNQWFDEVGYFSGGLAIVRLNGKENWFSLEKQDYLSPNLWFQVAGHFYYDGIAYVKLNGKEYYFTLDGQLLDSSRKRPLSQEELQELFQQQQQIDEMVNRLVKNYLR